MQDTQAVYKGLEPRVAVVRLASGMMRSIDVPQPTALTSAQLREVDQHPELQLLLRIRGAWLYGFVPPMSEGEAEALCFIPRRRGDRSKCRLLNTINNLGILYKEAICERLAAGNGLTLLRHVAQYSRALHAYFVGQAWTLSDKGHGRQFHVVQATTCLMNKS